MACVRERAHRRRPPGTVTPPPARAAASRASAARSNSPAGARRPREPQDLRHELLDPPARLDDPPRALGDLLAGALGHELRGALDRGERIAHAVGEAGAREGDGVEALVLGLEPLAPRPVGEAARRRERQDDERRSRRGRP